MARPSTLLRANSRAQSLLVQHHGQEDAPSAGPTIPTTARGVSAAATNRRVTCSPASIAAIAPAGARDDCTAYPTAERPAGLRTGRRLTASKVRSGVPLPGLPVSRMSTICAAASATAPSTDARASFVNDHAPAAALACASLVRANRPLPANRACCNICLGPPAFACSVIKGEANQGRGNRVFGRLRWRRLLADALDQNHRNVIGPIGLSRSRAQSAAEVAAPVHNAGPYHATPPVPAADSGSTARAVSCAAA
jgi:hypothetical protein